jgi:hypothetical protein
MKAAFVFVLVILAIIGPMAILKQREAAAAKASAAQLEASLKAEQDKSAALAGRPDVAADELARLREGQTELIRLRGEVNALRRERDDLQKKVSGLEGAVARAKDRADKEQTAARDAATGEEEKLKDRANTVLLGAQGGAIRRKILAGEALTAEEQQTVASMQQKAGDLEKAPAAFAEFQAAYIGSALGWNNDPRSQQLSDLLKRVTEVANNRGVSFNAPGQSYENWTDAQKQLDNRATGAVKGMLTPEEAAVFDKILPGVMSANPTAPARAQ